MKFIVRTTGQRDISNLINSIPDLIVCIDDRPNNNAMTCFEKALMLAGEDCCVHLEDDIILCDDFYNRITEIINNHKDDVIQFFSMRKDDLTIGTRYVNGRKFLMGQCFYLPKGMSKNILDYYHAGWKRINEHPTGLDTMVGDYLGDNKYNYLNIVPNLVDHCIGKSLIDPRRSSKRQSLTFVR